MARGLRIDVGDNVYHVINRASGKREIFTTDFFYRDFEHLLQEMKETFDMRILGYILMPNHWHLLLYPRKDGDLQKAMHWLQSTHTNRYRTQTKTVGMGHLYQGRYKSFLVEEDMHLLTVLKYIERNAARAKLCKGAEDWRWGSGHCRAYGTEKEKSLLAESPTVFPKNYFKWINDPEPAEILKDLRESVNKNIPFGSESWKESISLKD